MRARICKNLKRARSLSEISNWMVKNSKASRKLWADRNWRGYPSKPSPRERASSLIVLILSWLEVRLRMFRSKRTGKSWRRLKDPWQMISTSSCWVIRSFLKMNESNAAAAGLYSARACPSNCWKTRTQVLKILYPALRLWWTWWSTIFGVPVLRSNSPPNLHCKNWRKWRQNQRKLSNASEHSRRKRRR